MTKLRHIGFTAAIAALLLGAAAPAMADGPLRLGHDKAGVVATINAPTARKMPTLRYAQNAISPAQAKSIALGRVPGGEVVDINRRGDTYRVRVIARDGKVVDVYIDANSGRVKR